MRWMQRDREQEGIAGLHLMGGGQDKGAEGGGRWWWQVVQVRASEILVECIVIVCDSRVANNK